MKLPIFICTVLLVTACTAQEKRAQPNSFLVELAPSEVGYEKAREIALQYLSRVKWHDYDGRPIAVDRCDPASTSCDYTVRHWGNGCGWSSEVKETCTLQKCSYEISNYGEVLCE